MSLEAMPASGPTIIPFLRHPAFRHDGKIRWGGNERELRAEEQVAFEKLCRACCSFDELVAISSKIRGVSHREAAAALRQLLRSSDNLVGLIELPLPAACDVLVVEQGYGGVYVHTVELVKKLRKRWRVLLFAPVDPLFESQRHEDDYTLPRLKAECPSVGYFSYVQILRRVAKSLPCKLMLLTHRSQSLLLFDSMCVRPTVIYCDGYHDAGFRLARECRFGDSAAIDERILREVFFQLGNAGDFCGLLGSPSNTLELLAAGNLALFAAAENWCWGHRQREDFAEAFPELSNSLRFVPPFTAPALFDARLVDRSQDILFTTTMHNIDRKGFPELLAVLELLPEARARCVVRQPDKLPAIPGALLNRLKIDTLSKSEMTVAYHRAWVNCRTSREESSPLSILEGMICELPAIVSPAVAEQLPIIVDGESGFVVDPDDPALLARRLGQVLGDKGLRDRLGRRAREKACELSLDGREYLFERFLE